MPPPVFMNPEARRPPVEASADEPDAKRRKVRKGTRSCWECKRRKIRCTFAAPADIVCDGCRRRGTGCVSQEYPDEPAPAPAARPVSDRLGRMEALVELLMKQATANAGPTLAKEAAELLGGDAATSTASASSTPAADSTEFDHTSPSEGGIMTPDSMSQVGSRASKRSAPRRSDPAALGSSPSSVPSPARPPSTVPLGQRYVSHGDGHESIRTTLLEAWPPQADMALIRSVLTGTLAGAAGIMQQLHCTPYVRLFKPGTIPSIDRLLTLPEPNAHPVLFIISLLTLAVLLQHVSATANPELGNLTRTPREIMARIADVTGETLERHEDMLDSLEGLQALMLNSMYEANVGNIRKSFLRMRRVIALAQMMGLHRKGKIPNLRMLDPSTRELVNPHYMWFRIVFTDRYLSLMLGLPHGTASDDFGSLADMEHDVLLGRLELSLVRITGHISQRNERLGDPYPNARLGEFGPSPDAATDAMLLELDMELQAAARSMPPQWWVTPKIEEFSSMEESFKATLRLMAQFFYNFLVAQTHLPYVMRPGRERRYDYSKMSAANACREVLNRFISFRSVNVVAFSCRAVDLFAFVSALTLCLMHLQGHQQEAQIPGTQGNFLLHQRSQDRGMMENVVENYELLGRVNDDPLSIRSAAILRQLMAIEAAAAEGTAYTTWHTNEPTPCETKELGTVEEESERNKSLTLEKELLLCIPYFGTIKIAQSGVSRSADVDNGNGNCSPRGASALQDADFSTAPAQGGRPGTYQFGQSSNADWHAVPTHHTDMSAPDPGAFGFVEGFEEPQVLVPGLQAGIEEWPFQGMDMAFFDSLMRGAVSSSSTAPAVDGGVPSGSSESAGPPQVNGSDAAPVWNTLGMGATDSGFGMAPTDATKGTWPRPVVSTQGRTGPGRTMTLPPGFWGGI